MTQALTREATDGLRRFLKEREREFAVALQRQVDVGYFLSVVMNACIQKPKLITICTRASLYKAIMNAAQLRLSCDGMLGQSYLVPYKEQAQLVIGYRGKRELALRTGKYKDIYAHVVRAGDPFRISLGTQQFIEHEPAEEDRGDIRACYAVAVYHDGTALPEFMWVSEIETHKKQYSRAWQKSDSIWQTNYEMGCKKTLVGRLCGRLQMTPDVQRVLQAESRMEAGLDLPADDFSDVYDIETTEPDTEAGGEEKTPKKGVEGLTEDLNAKFEPDEPDEPDDPVAEARQIIRDALSKRHPGSEEAQKKTLTLWTVRGLKKAYSNIMEIPVDDLSAVVDVINAE